jgi:hypothetical protein
VRRKPTKTKKARKSKFKEDAAVVGDDVEGVVAAADHDTSEAGAEEARTGAAGAAPDVDAER